MAGELRQSPLAERHVAAGAKFMAFGGWEMPREYSGTLAEHMACRSSAVMWDVSHLGTVRLVGPEGSARIQRTLTNDLTRIGAGRAQYTLLLDDEGSVVDDIIIWWWQGPDPGHPGELVDIFDVMPNASNTDSVIEALGGVDVTAERAVIAVQGPQARAKVRAIWPEAAEVGRFAVRPALWRGHSCVVAGTGYTGEEGLEISVPVAGAVELWDALADAGILPAGLAARDTVRLEAGLALHGQELGPGITPLQAGLAWVVAFDKETFIGRDALLREKAAGPHRHLRGLVTEGRRPLRTGYPVSILGDNGELRPCGEVTSGNFSPTLERGIALAFLAADVHIGDQVMVDVRGTLTPAEVVQTSFLPPRR